MTAKSYTLKIEQDASGMFTASIEEIPGCHTQGMSEDECRSRIREAMALFLPGDEAEKAEINESRAIAHHLPVQTEQDETSTPDDEPTRS